MIGIYVITNVANLKVYVGQSIDIRRRWTVGEEAYNARISNRDATAICEMLQAGKKICEISKITRISYGIVKAIKQRRSWLSISSKFSF